MNIKLEPRSGLWSNGYYSPRVKQDGHLPTTRSKPDLSCQNKFIPIDFSLQIVPGTFDYALAHIVDNRLDLSGFDKCFLSNKVER